MRLKNEIRQILCLLSKQCSYENYVMLSGKKYRIGCMSYDEYFIEPWRKGHSERDPFHKDTLWERSDGIEIMQLLIDNDYLSITID